MNLEPPSDVANVEGSQKLLVIAGWNLGFNKIEFTTMLKNELGYSLSIAKNITDQVLTSQPVELQIPESSYERISLESDRLGAKVLNQSHTLGSRENSCP
jgi:hypothetical protein